MGDIFSADRVEGSGRALGPPVRPQRAGASAASSEQTVSRVRSNQRESFVEENYTLIMSRQKLLQAILSCQCKMPATEREKRK